MVSAQYYLRGEIKDEKGNPLPNAKMILHSTGYLYYSGSSGGYGIQITKSIDTLTVSIEGFQEQTVAVKCKAGRPICTRTGWYP